MSSSDRDAIVLLATAADMSAAVVASAETYLRAAVDRLAEDPTTAALRKVAVESLATMRLLSASLAKTCDLSDDALQGPHFASDDGSRQVS